MQTRGRNRLDIQQQNDKDVRHYIKRLMDEQNIDRAQPYIDQLMNNQNHSETQDHDGKSNELMNSFDGGIGESGNLKTKHVCGPTLLKDIWKLPPGKTFDVLFNSRNQSIGKEGQKHASFLGIVKKFTIPKRGEDFVLKSLGKKWRDYKCYLKGEHIPKHKPKDTLLKNRPSCIPRDQWSGLVSYWLSDKAKDIVLLFEWQRRTQANRNNRSKQKIPHIGESKSIATLMAEKDMINEKMKNSERPSDQPPRSVACEGDVYSRVFENEKSGYVHGLGLGPTPSVLWGCRSSLGNIVVEDSSNEVVQRLEYKIVELKEKQN
ncbi:hypothetical protein FXO38_21139 [Capsicum annuum]|nr:hypothetical protein FXO37_24397 [Capsicum annuum]KAF3642358.1 hypothetical protein FXO38_21139 [Capsicum annuum]